MPHVALSELNDQLQAFSIKGALSSASPHDQ